LIVVYKILLLMPSRQLIALKKRVLIIDVPFIPF
jgi:hypothetical protein